MKSLKSNQQGLTLNSEVNREPAKRETHVFFRAFLL